MLIISKITEKKKQIYDRYAEAFCDIKNIHFFYIGYEEISNYWFSSFLFENKNGLKGYLRANEIQTRDFFYPLHKQPCYFSFDQGDNFPNSMYLFDHGLSLPSSYGLSWRDQKYIIKKIKSFYGV